VSVTDVLAASLHYVSATASQGACSGSGVIVTCELGTLGAGAAATVAIVVVPTEPGPKTSVLTVSSPTVTDPNPANNSSAHEDGVIAPAPVVDSHVTVIQDSGGYDAQDVRYTLERSRSCFISAPWQPSNWLLVDDDDDPVLPRSAEYSLHVPCFYTLRQTALAGYALQAIDCAASGGASAVPDLARGSVDLDLSAGGDIACTFRNAPGMPPQPDANFPGPPGSLTVIENTSPDLPDDFVFALRLDGPCAGNAAGYRPGRAAVLDDDPSSPLLGTYTFANLQPCVYSLRGLETPGFTTISVTCGAGDLVDATIKGAFLSIAPGESTTCVFTDAKAP